MTINKDLNILKDLKDYKKPISKFHESMYAYICNNFISIDEEKKLREVFRYIDKNDKNALSKENLKACFKEINIELNSDELDSTFKLLDANKNNTIEYQEFLRAACNKKTLLNEDNLKNAFLALKEGEDKEYIIDEDIKKFIFHDLNVKDEIFNEYLEQFGMKKDEKIYFKEFCDILQNNKKLEKKEEDNDNKEDNEKNGEIEEKKED